MCDLIRKASGNVITIDHMKYSHFDMRKDSRVFTLRMPITGEDEKVYISSQCYEAKIVPMAVVAQIDHYTWFKNLMHLARDLRVMNDDLSPMCSEEARTFGVREMQPNRCIPRLFTRKPDLRMDMNGNYYWKSQK